MVDGRTAESSVGGPSFQLPGGATRSDLEQACDYQVGCQGNLLRSNRAK